MDRDGVDGSAGEGPGPNPLELLLPLLRHWKLWIIGSLLVGVLMLGISFLMAPVYTARTSFLPPQQQQGGAAAALASLSGLGGLAGLGVSAGLRSPSDQYVALMQSATVLDRMVDRFDLMKVYESDYRFQARKELESLTRIVVGKKDGLISVEVDDTRRERAAQIANAYIEELRRMTSVLAVTEAQQRRAFFQKELEAARDQLAQAQQALQASGFTVGALRAEPRAAAEGYARLKAEITATEVRLQVLRGNLADTAPEVRQQLAALAELRAQLARLEQVPDAGKAGPDYVSKYREFKYRETLFELLARQYEIARIDESREGALIQVVDEAKTPEYKSKPKRAQLAVSATFVALLLLGGFILIRDAWRRGAEHQGGTLARMRAALRGG